MRKIKLFGAACAALLLVSAHANAQGIFKSILTPAVGETTIGPDGTYYAVVAGTGSTVQAPVTDLMAVGLAATPATKWSVTLNGHVGQVLPGATTVYVVETTTSGTGRNATITTTVALLSAATGVQTGTITPTGSISDIEVRTINGTDYLYIYTTTTTSSTSGNTTSFTTTRTLTIYSSTGSVIKSVTL